MPRMGVIGGGPVGLTTALIAADRGWDVVVFERDVSPVPTSPEDAWDDWERNTVAQFRMAHTLLPLGASILRDHLPEVLERMFEAGGARWSSFDFLPPGAADLSDDDLRFVSVGARRPIYEMAFASVADDHEGVEVRRGATVERLVAGEAVIDGVAHVAGVVADGAAEYFDMVIDAGGRRSRVPEMITAIGGAEPRVVSEDSRFTYYGRHYRRRNDMPRPFAPRFETAGSFGVLLLPGDNETWSVTIYSATSDRLLRAVRDNDTFDRVIGAVPSVAAWFDGEPITDVLMMTGVLDRQRDYVVDGVPIATGVVPVGDSWACTNPSQGRGISFGLLHALRTVEALDVNRGDVEAQAHAWHEATMADVEPWHAATLSADRRYIETLTAAMNDEPWPEPTGGAALMWKATHAMQHDIQIFRWVMEYIGCFTLPRDLFARPGVVERIERVAAAHPPPTPTPQISRQKLEALLAG